MATNPTVKNQESDFYGRFWNKKIEGDNIFHGHPDWRKSLEKRLKYYSSMLKGKILDAGCGEGTFSLNIAKIAEVKEVTGIDLSKTAIKKCTEQAKKSNLSDKAMFRTGSITDLPFKNDAFDSVFAFEIVEHIVDTEKMFQELNRVLKKDGYLGITTVDFNKLKIIIISLFYFETYFDPTTPHIRFFTKNTLKRMLEKNGFKVIRYQWDGSYFGIMPMGQAVIAQKHKDV